MYNRAKDSNYRNVSKTIYELSEIEPFFTLLGFTKMGRFHDLHENGAFHDLHENGAISICTFDIAIRYGNTS